MQTLAIDTEFKALIPPLTDDERRQLEENLLAEGCRDALVTWNGVLIDGHNRYEICTRHGIDFRTTERTFATRNDAKLWMVRNQMGRRNLSDFQRTEIWLSVKPVLVEKAKANMSAGGVARAASALRGDDGVFSSQGLSNFTTPGIEPVGGVRDQIAQFADVSSATVHKVEKILKHGTPEEIEAGRRGEVSTSKLYDDVQRRLKEERREVVRENNRALVAATIPATQVEPGATYQTIVLDPPWDWGDEGDADQFGRARPTYATMSIDQIAALPVRDLAADNAHIYLWITNRSLPKGFALLEAWGFRYVTCVTWCKPSIGMGNYFRGSTEQILFGVRGSLPLLRNNVGTWFSAPRGDRHSAKPTAFYEMVESCSPGPWLEMFARSERSGWAQWGAEVPA